MKRGYLQYLSIFTFFLLLFVGCGSGTRLDTSDASETLSTHSYRLPQVEDESFNALSEENKIYVAKKLYTTLFKGEDINTLKAEVGSGTFISDFHKKLASTVSQPDEDKIIAPNEELFRDDTGGGDAINRKKGEADQTIISRMIYTKLGKSYYSDWMAYKLNQTILLSPGWEVDTMRFFPRFILSNFDRLRDAINKNRPIRDIVREHMASVENWARFRSPEDNGREMLEIWNYDFNDAHVPLAAKVLKNWKFYTYYERPNEKYTFIQGEDDNENNESVDLLGQQIKTGREFFDAVVENDNFMHTVVDRIVGHFFPTFDADSRESIARKIVESKPTTFKDIFDQILFSQAYLYESDKVKTIEETAFSLIDTLHFTMGTGTISAIDRSLGAMNQRIMTYKLGREEKVPTDTISMNAYHKTIRELIMINRDESATYPNDNGIDFGKLSQRYDDTNMTTFIDGIFLDVLGRKASDLEQQKLQEHFRNTTYPPNTTLADTNNNGVKATDVWIILDYLSRLTELYQYKKVMQ